MTKFAIVMAILCGVALIVTYRKRNPRRVRESLYRLRRYDEFALPDEDERVLAAWEADRTELLPRWEPEVRDIPEKNVRILDEMRALEDNSVRTLINHYAGDGHYDPDRPLPEFGTYRSPAPAYYPEPRPRLPEIVAMQLGAGSVEAAIEAIWREVKEDWDRAHPLALSPGY